MDGNGTEDPTQVPETPAPPPWMHDFLPASCIFDCQGPDCDQSARAYWQNNVGFIAPGWQALDQRPFCSWLCVARYAALRAQDQIAQYPGGSEAREQIESAHAEAQDLVSTRKRTRHN